MSLSIEIRGDKEAIQKFKKLGEKDLINARKRWLEEAAILLVGEAKKQAPVNKGLLRNSIKYKVYSNYSLVYSNLSYAPFVHEGTAPHIIMPKFKKALHWIDPKPKEDRFAGLVHHPGYKGNPFFANATKEMKPRIIERFNEIINEYIND